MASETFIRKLMASMKCGVCGEHYKIDDINVLGHEEELWFLRADCSACHTQCLVAAVIKEGGEPELVTDLTGAELGKFKNMGEITADDVLDMHGFLKGFEGDFSRLFNRKEA